MAHRTERIAPAAARRGGKRKRGIVLLVVVSLLALFVLMGVAYAIIASHYLATTTSNVRYQEVGDPPEREMDLILGQMLYDTLGRSSLRYHSLLGDLYGGDSVACQISVNPTALDTMPMGASQPQSYQFSATATSGVLNITPGHYAGRVLTFLTGNAAGHSTRIIEYAAVPSGMAGYTYNFAIETPEVGGGTFPTLAAGDQFLINGAPFNGSGFGFYPSAVGGNDQLDASYAAPDGSGAYLLPNPIALLPHFSGYDPVNGTLSADPTNGGADESYDAADYQNMVLAMVAPITAQNAFDNNPATPEIPVLPSLHRPELVHYWFSNMPSDIPRDMSGNIDWYHPITRNFLRSFIFRPTFFDHPAFSGSNPAFDRNHPDWHWHLQGLKRDPNDPQQPPQAATLPPVVGNLWDVDNDNDGVPDSIWIDPGLPVVTSPDGRRYKRLVAILVKDMDGRADLNAHGNLHQVSDANHRAETATPGALGLAGMGAYLPRGSGFGPAEVDFLNIFGLYSDAAARTAYTNLLTARYTSNLTGDTGLPGIPTVRDDQSILNHHGVPNNYAGQVSWYASPNDVYGRGIQVLDHGGHPITLFMGQNNEMIDTPYELSLSGQPNNADSPYTVFEGEALLRYHDGDIANLPSRPLFPTIAGNYLGGAQGAIDVAHARRELLRVQGSYIPTPMTTGPRERRTAVINSGGGMGAMTVMDLYRERLLNAGVSSADVDAALRQIVPWEFFHGQRFNINRWLGDGFDSNGDGTPDDPVEAATENAFQGPAGFTGVAAQHTNGLDADLSGPPNNPGPIDNTLARQLYARHLYCLAMLMMPPNFQPNCPHDATITPAQYRRLIVRRIAQWAVNCAEFRDPDSIMTPFEYDEFPFRDDDGNTANGTWDVDGWIARTPGPDGQINTMDDIGSADDALGVRGYVWGLEYPDLLISETFATHDRRVKDTDQDPSGDDRDDTPMNDEDLDQFRVPQGSMFIELVCPRNTYGRNPQLPRELYDYSNAGNPRLQLGRLAPDNRPVWRLAISPIVYNDGTYGPRHPQGLAVPNAESASFEPLEVNRVPGGTPNGPAALPADFRFAYFGNAGALPAGELAYAFHNTASNPLVEPGQYVVVGPRPRTYLGSQDPVAAGTTPSLWGGNSPQYIDINAGGITIVDADGTTTSRTPGTDIRPAVPVICDMPGVTPVSGGAPWSMVCPWNIGLNISEPLPLVDNYYPEPMLSVTPAGASAPDFYDDPDMPTQMYRDEPVEAPVADYPGNADRPIAVRSMNETGPYLDASSVYLQRLANPNLPFNPDNNPYITIDWATVDLNVFSGEENTARTVGAGPDMGNSLDPYDDSDVNNRPNNGRLIGSRQRGYMPTAGVPDSNFWSPLVPSQPPNLPVAGATEPYLRFNLSGFNQPQERQTLGFVNWSVGQPQGAPYLGEPNLTASGQTSPWLAWHNRPFMNPMELLLVPTSAPSRLGWEITPGHMRGLGGGSGVGHPDVHYDSANDNAFRSPFGTLLNLFHSADANANPNQAAQLCRLLDFVEVPSPYSGAERWYNPSHFGAAGNLRPPFNKVSRFRDPGRININTIFDERIWVAAIGNAPLLDREAGNPWNQSTFFQKVMQSRQGYGGGLLSLNGAYPTFFANPFRTADSSDLMPNVPAGPGSMRKNEPVDATFLRRDPNQPAQPLFSVRSNQGHDNTERNPYFRYQGLQKIGSTFSTQSNVYAVWMTIGYFEVEPATYDFNSDGDTTDPGETWDTMNAVQRAAWPDRYQLGPEIGSETGEVKRHRAFFMIDRSIPVGFQPGQKLNTDKCVLLRRFIE